VQQDGTAWRIVKGAVQAVAPLAVSADDDWQKEAQTVASGGVRVLAVVAGPPQDMHPIGLIGLRDPPREDSADLVHALQQMGVRLIMVTGDALPTALAVADIVGIGSRAGDLDAFRRDPAHPLDCDVLAGVLPEDKYHLVQASQHGGHITGMTGDGVNDAPALKQAEVGIAVASATDVAKAAASIVLTTPGIGNIVAAEQTSRRIYQRMLTYTLNKIIKTCEIALLLSVGLIVTGVFVTTPTLIVLLLFTNDFVTMSIATDRVSFSPKPTRWHVRALVRTALSMAGLILLLSFAIFFTARNWLPLPQLQTLIFLMLVFSGQGTVYLVREHRHFWASVPSRWMLVSSLLDIVIVSIFAIFGIFMAPLAMSWIGLVLLTVLAYLTAIDFLKTRIMRYVQ
jgi:H+-transporting ATPase